MNKYISIIGTAILASLVGWYGCEYKQTCPGDTLCTLERAEANPAEIARYCEDLIPQQEIITEYVPRYIQTKCPACDCTELESQAWQECIQSYEEFHPILEEPCVGLCPIKIYRGSNERTQ